MLLKNALDALASVLFPGPCRVCGEALTNASRIPLCESCLAGFEEIVPPMCTCCGRPFHSQVAAEAAQPLCRLCRVNYYSFDRARSFAVYNDALFEAVLLLKYEAVGRLGNWFAARLATMLSREAVEWRADVVVPVPLDRARRRERGYNQAELIARPPAKRLNLPIEPRMLVRTKARPPQLLVSRGERWKSVRGAYATNEGVDVDNLRILLVDDVLTTGATLDACSRVLKKAGAAAVFGVTVARVRSWQAGLVSVAGAQKSRVHVKPDGGGGHPI